MNSLPDETARTLIINATQAQRIEDIEIIQQLWSGYGHIYRVHLSGARYASVVLKHIQPPASESHPRGWTSEIAYQRKLKSYRVELAWYRQWSHQCSARVARCYASHRQANQIWLILEDLDDSGFNVRHTALTVDQCRIGLQWLASLHADFLHAKSDQLWDTGTYWHLATRPDELAAMPQSPLRKSAAAIDTLLRQARFQTIVHGDAKVANFCFHPDGQQLAAVDFQYAGSGCGMKDVAYFLGSCLSDQQLENEADSLLNDYFTCLHHELAEYAKFDELEREWRNLYPLAWTDFYRFMSGWMPTHKKINRYTLQLADACLARQDVIDLAAENNL